VSGYADVEPHKTWRTDTVREAMKKMGAPKPGELGHDLARLHVEKTYDAHRAEITAFIGHKGAPAARLAQLAGDTPIQMTWEM
jgi:hypothetical protein